VVGLRLSLVLEACLLEVRSGVRNGVLFLFKLGLGGDGTAIDCLVLLCGLAGGVLAALAVSTFSLETVNLFLGFGNVLLSC
jgi:hypothetical protein